MVEGRLPVGQGGGNAVHQHGHPAYAELGAGAEAADGNALTDRRVVAVLHLDAGEALERLLDGESGLAQRERRFAEHRHGERNLAQQDGRAQHRHFDFVERNHCRRIGLLSRQRGGEVRHDQRQGEACEGQLTRRVPLRGRAGHAPGPWPDRVVMRRMGHRRVPGWEGDPGYACVPAVGATSSVAGNNTTARGRERPPRGIRVDSSP